jgi:Nucleotidyl transferase AbiEii toxin, Type IV TA system
MVVAIVMTVMLVGMLCMLAYTLATYALPFMLALVAARFAHETGAGFIGAALVGQVTGAVSFGALLLLFAAAREPIQRIAVALIFTAPAAVAGYALVHGVTGELVPSLIWRAIFSVIGGLATGLSALAQLAASPPRGVRVKTTAFLGRTRIPVQVDVGFGDAVTPAAQELEFPSLLSAEGPRLKAYPRETVVAEKLQAIVALGHANSRMKDYYDLLALSPLFAFEGQSLTQAMRATFERRGTPPTTDTPVGLSTAFAEDSEKARQWSAFVGREPLLLQPPNFPAVIVGIAEFVLAPLRASAGREEFGRRWPAGGPWTYGSASSAAQGRTGREERSAGRAQTGTPKVLPTAQNTKGLRCLRNKDAIPSFFFGWSDWPWKRILV